MKKLIIISFLILGIFFVSPVSASAETKAGIKPGSFWYDFDITFEKIGIFFTFSPEKKVQKNLEYANERLAEAEAVAEENKPEAVATAMANYQKNVSLATTKAKAIKDEVQMETLLSIIANNTSKHQEVLAEVYNKVPDEAKKAIEKAIEISIKEREKTLKEIQGLKKTVEELQKDIESLKQQGQLDQSKQIEALKKEVETLKSRQSSQSAKPQIIEKVVEKAVEKIVEVPPATPQKPNAKLSNSEIIEKVKPAVVYIQTSDGSGSGMIIESNGYVLTNAHVVNGFSAAKIKLSDGRLFIGSVVGRDEKVDLALLKVNGDGFSFVELGNSDKNVLGQGDEIFSVGYSYGFEEDVSFKNGIISRRLTDESRITYLEITAEIQPGNSGGPLVNRFGQVVGINTFSYGKTGDPLKFALPINLARGLITDLKAGRNVTAPKIALPSPSLPSPSPTPTPQPTPEPTPPAPSCTKDTWDCSDWSECSNYGSQSRACNITFDCSVANTPSPNTIQSCTPPPSSIEIEQTSLSENVSDYTFYNRTPKYIGYTSATVKVWQSVIKNPHEQVRIEVYLGGNMVSPIRINDGIGNFIGNFTVPTSSITGISEETATMITVPLTNELGVYCNSCGHMVIPTARANNPKDVAAYIHFETHADGVDNPNDRYFIKLISFKGKIFGTKETQTNMGTVYTF